MSGYVQKFENHFPDFSILGLLRFPNFSRYFYYVYMSKNTNSNYIKSNVQVGLNVPPSIAVAPSSSPV